MACISEPYCVILGRRRAPVYDKPDTEAISARVKVQFNDVRLACALHDFTGQLGFQASRLSLLPEDVLDRIFSMATPAYVPRRRSEAPHGPHGPHRWAQPPVPLEDMPSVPCLPPQLRPLSTRDNNVTVTSSVQYAS